MPIWRFQSPEDAERALWLTPGDPAIRETWQALSALAALAPAAAPPRGVRVFRTIEEANSDTEAWIARRVEAGRRRVTPPGQNNSAGG